MNISSIRTNPDVIAYGQDTQITKSRCHYNSLVGCSILLETMDTVLKTIITLVYVGEAGQHSYLHFSYLSSNLSTDVIVIQ